MSDPLDAIFRRRSIREYTEEPVSEEAMERLLQAAMAAPSGRNLRPWHLVTVTDPALLRTLGDKHPYGSMIAKAAAGIAVCGDPSVSHWWVQDCSAATENILIAAAGLGLGAVWLGCYTRPEREQAVRDVLGIPPEINVLSLIAIGHPAEHKEPRSQYEAEKVHRNGWNRS